MQGSRPKSSLRGPRPTMRCSDGCDATASCGAHHPRPTASAGVTRSTVQYCIRGATYRRSHPMKISPSPVKLARFVCGAGTRCIGKGITGRRWMCCVWMIPNYKEPLLVGTTASELTTEELGPAYPHRWPVETLFYRVGPLSN